MESKQNFDFLKPLLFITIALIIAKFIFTDGLNILYQAFKPFLLACIFIYLFWTFSESCS